MEDMVKARSVLVLCFVVPLLAASCGDSGTASTSTTAPQQSASTTTTSQPLDSTSSTSAPGETTSTITSVTTTSNGTDSQPIPGFDPDTGTIRLGVLTATTGPMVDQGRSRLSGHEAYWGRVNDAGGVAGQFPVELVIRDHSGAPEQNIAMYEEIRDDVLAISSTLGGRFVEAIHEDASDRNLLISAGSKESYWALTNNVVLNAATDTYFSELANAVYWARNVAGPPAITDASKVGIIYQSDDYGEDCKAGYDLAMSSEGLVGAFEATYAPGDSDFSSQIDGARAANVDVLFLCTVPAVLAPMVGTMAASMYFPKLIGSSASYDPTLLSALGGGDADAGAALFNMFPYFSLGTTPSWESENSTMGQMRTDWEKSGHGAELINRDYFSGYTEAMTFHAILERAAAKGDLSRSNVLASLDELAVVDLGLGHFSGYGPGPGERIPFRGTAIGLPTTTDEAAFGIAPVSMAIVAPYLEDWVPGP